MLPSISNGKQLPHQYNHYDVSREPAPEQTVCFIRSTSNVPIMLRRGGSNKPRARLHDSD